ncbi:hypothetical protein P872_00925 [Rhodonellum psychrophilum GCM71 = DSM 17998]|uniref:Peptidase M28 domain-containing protein n=2 Tax=Rhodonellum TaxID=336827 RepID=U5C2R3_9BACT|nr:MULTISPECIES: M28 family peptidase [Rhodonellum]ERM84104.1 hypothetical protein P872_00925 [Rhodonellum psychrophilum GCM71 = DSM 17998]SDY42021.1 Peptidase family M28 [Rhodonellum ikkaensis]
MKNPIKFLSFLIWLMPVALLAQSIDGKTVLQDIQYLSGDQLGGRKTLSEGNLVAREYIKERFKSQGLHSQFSDFTQFFNFKNEREGKFYENAANIVGFMPGSETDKLIVVMAHYDHIGQTDEVIFNGADDNASGVAALLSLSEYFSKNRPMHSMMFVALDAEEMGLQGAKALVNDFPFPIEQVVLNINMDMISRNDKNELYAVGTYHYPKLKPILEKVSQGKSPKLMLGHDQPNTGFEDWTMSSDHALFHKNNIPFIYFGVEDHQDYHQPTDTFENIHPEFYLGAVQLILDALIAFDKELIPLK